MDVALHEAGEGETAPSVLARRICVDAWLDRGDRPFGDTDVEGAVLVARLALAMTRSSGMARC
jgi:hypothetical protein